MRLHFKGLHEKDRRRYAAVEALKLGHGGTAYISRILPIHRTTIIAGKKELAAMLAAVSPALEGRQRHHGGGRKKKGR